MLAVLNDAAQTYWGGETGRARPGLRREVDEWFASDDPAWPFSLVNCCHALGLDPVEVRARVAYAHQMLAA